MCGDTPLKNRHEGTVRLAFLWIETDPESEVVYSKNIRLCLHPSNLVVSAKSIYNMTLDLGLGLTPGRLLFGLIGSNLVSSTVSVVCIVFPPKICVRVCFESVLVLESQKEYVSCTRLKACQII